MESFHILALIIIALSSYVIYQLMTQKIKPMELDKGGFIKGETIHPDFSRTDLVEFLSECEKNSIDNKLGKDFIIAGYNNSTVGIRANSPKIKRQPFRTMGS